jgi:predicted HTH transcriptional regulator
LANGNGGNAFIGKDDTAKVIGMSDSKKLPEEIRRTENSTKH